MTFQIGVRLCTAWNHTTVGPSFAPFFILHTECSVELLSQRGQQGHQASIQGTIWIRQKLQSRGNIKKNLQTRITSEMDSPLPSKLLGIVQQMHTTKIAN